MNQADTTVGAVDRFTATDANETRNMPLPALLSP